MRNFLIRVVINAIAISITAWVLPGIHIADDGLMTLLIIGLIFGVVNALVKPILVALTCPMVILTFGLFVLVINGFMLQIVGWLAGPSLTIDGFGWALLGGLIMSVTVMILENFMGLNRPKTFETPKRNIPR